MASDSSVCLVQAVYSFKGKNNDELCFKKGDIITVTQREEGGWWEGTLGEKTGWFPSNYVKEYTPLESGASGTTKISPVKLPPDIAAQQKAYRNLVLKDLIESEKAHVAELQTLLKNFLSPLEKSDILSRDEYRQLVSNIVTVVETHQQLLTALEECSQRPPQEQRVGKIFLTSAPRLKQVHHVYCSSHPRAVCILDKYRDQLNSFMEAHGAVNPGILVLTTGLSKPFRRLEKYSGMLQELERHVEESHPDRGDTQRSVSVYKDIASFISTTRRQKELELEVLTGGVRGWEGENLSCLGEILHMGSVAILPDHRDRYLVLFPSTLLMLSVSQRMSAFIYEGKLPLTGINVNKLDDTETYKNAFEISGPMIERIVAVCQTRDDQTQWVDHLKQQIRKVTKSSVSSPPPTSPPPSKPQPLPPPHVSVAPLSPYSNLTSLFAELVQHGIITRKLLKHLLYSEFTAAVKVIGVKIRHSHKAEYVIFPKSENVGTCDVAHKVLLQSESEEDPESDDSFIYCLEAESNSESQKTSVLERQDAVDIDSDQSDNDSVPSSISHVRYYSNTGCFTNYGGSPCDRTPQCKPKCQSVSEFVYKQEYSPKEVESAFSRLENSDLINRTSNQQKLCEVQEDNYKISSNESSFERNSLHRTFPCGVCEDLTNISEYEDTLSRDQLSVELCRNSMPVSAQPRKCSCSHSVSIFSSQFPHVKSEASFKCHATTLLQSKKLSTQSLPITLGDSNSPPTTHSSTLDLPAKTIPVPSSVLAGLLYGESQKTEDAYPKCHPNIQQQNSASSDKSAESTSTVCSLPFVSKSKVKITSEDRTSISTISERNTKPLDSCRSFSHHDNRGRGRYRSYQYVTIKQRVSSDKFKNSKSTNCQCCSDIPSSSRSSDSGLADIAGNSTLTSPDLSNIVTENEQRYSSARSVESFHPGASPTPRESTEFEDFNYEAQCMCTSPFGSTPRTSAQPSPTSEKLLSGLCDSVTSITSASKDQPPVPAAQLWESTGNQPAAAGSGIYRSGMYAHWWLKTKLPASAVRGSAPASTQTEECLDRPSVTKSQHATNKRKAGVPPS